jgi:hypothetical protein
MVLVLLHLHDVKETPPIPAAASSLPIMSSAILFDDLFEVTKLNPDGKKFDRCDRVISSGEAYEIELFLDIASELYQLRTGDKFTMTLTSTLNPDGTPDSDEYSPDYKVRLARIYVLDCPSSTILISSTATAHAA